MMTSFLGGDNVHRDLDGHLDHLAACADRWERGGSGAAPDRAQALRVRDYARRIEAANTPPRRIPR